MTVLTPPRKTSGAERLRWALADGWTVAKRDLTHWAQQPAVFIVGLLFPVLMLLMFALFFGGAITPPTGSYQDFLVPGLLGLTMVFGVETTFTAISTDLARGVTDRFRSLPMAGSAVVTGRCIADLLNAIAVLAVLVLAGLAIGWRWHEGLGPALAAFGLLLLLRVAMLWLGIYLGLLLRRAEAVQAIQILVWPLGFLSNAFVAPTTMPGWLGAIAEWNPLSATVAAVRELFGNPGWASGSWLGDYAILAAIGWPVLLIAVFYPLSVRRYRQLGG
ncbi:multidrug ABC transporter permease [Prauserella marina]|uniref:Transport permease protein n=1 Tax=Prauserella marina TaxID=530584 RepID=A0A222VVP3_9PSEU|nr:ABC transporter permease [Prauserella marina]ASR37998.1 multidrug ABC transporter permease [Prauserella marina]PWV73228.1 ABC transporter DrrB family efflux protein [Prauserella marina]SDD68772.1 ABC transporter efflux protein, DrrB family [Prauserella marina]